MRTMSKKNKEKGLHLALTTGVAVEVVGPWSSPSGQPSLVGRKGVTRGMGFCYSGTIAVLLDEPYLTYEDLLPSERDDHDRLRYVFLDPTSLREI